MCGNVAVAVSAPVPWPVCKRKRGLACVRFYCRNLFCFRKKITTFAMKAILPCRPPASEDAA